MGLVPAENCSGYSFSQGAMTGTGNGRACRVVVATVMASPHAVPDVGGPIHRAVPAKAWDQHPKSSPSALGSGLPIPQHPQQRLAVRNAEPGAGIPARPRLVTAVVALGDVAEAGLPHAGGHTGIQRRL